MPTSGYAYGSWEIARFFSVCWMIAAHSALVNLAVMLELRRPSRSAQYYTYSFIASTASVALQRKRQAHSRIVRLSRAGIGSCYTSSVTIGSSAQLCRSITSYWRYQISETIWSAGRIPPCVFDICRAWPALFEMRDGVQASVRGGTWLI